MSCATLTNRPHQAGLWLASIHESMAVLNAILSITHPTLHAAAMRARTRILQTHEASTVGLWLRRWSSLFTHATIHVGDPAGSCAGHNPGDQTYEMRVILGDVSLAVVPSHIGGEQTRPDAVPGVPAVVSCTASSSWTAGTSSMTYLLRMDANVVREMPVGDAFWVRWSVYRRFCHGAFLARYQL